jgi:hypothetical protein
MRDATESTDPLVVAIAGMPEVVANLLRDHRPDRHGKCNACGLPGTGTPYLDWACALYTIADRALNIRRLRIAKAPRPGTVTEPGEAAT